MMSGSKTTCGFVPNAPVLLPSQFQSRLCPLRRRSRQVQAPIMSLDAAHALPELINHLIVSCGIGLAGIVGAKATEEVRALTAGDRRADEMTALAVEIDSFRRRKELASRPGDRDWADVTVDRFSNLQVVPESVPELESQDDLNAFDRLLTQSVRTDSSRAQDSLPSLPTTQQLIDPSHFLMEDERASPSS